MPKLYHQSGMTLIEITVAVTAFSIVIVGVIGAFLSGMGGTQRINSQQNIMDVGRYVMESMAKEIRMSEILNPFGTNALMPSCDSQSSTRSCLLFKNSRDETMYFVLWTDSRIYKDLASVPINATAAVLTPDEVEVSNLHFEIDKSFGLQPRVTISMKLTAREQGGKEIHLYLQNTVSSRQYQSEGSK
ncbi:MAG: MSHA biogenesis protein MshO [Parcubacteria group bacterium GW2011_GWB1_42_6]|nr:MAG: MSHA biogenesis protein MshO [Parcubacteria group bacterium GW2011_GWB1_42_6]